MGDDTDPANWSSGPFAIYSSRTDKRFWVPKRNRALGWTINFGHPWGLAVFVAILVVPLLAVLGTVLFVIATR